MFRRKRKDGDFSDEIESHIQLEAERLREQGLSEGDARAAARRVFGNVTQAQERFYESHRWLWWDRLSQDICFGLRMLRKSPSFTAVAVLTVALGIGVTTAIVSVVDPILFRPLPYANADRLVSVGIKHAAEPFEFMLGSFYYDWSDHQTAFTQMTAQSALPRPCDLTDREPMRLTCSYVHQNFLPTLGITPPLGRDFTADDMLPNAPPTAMLSYKLWKTRYNERPSIINHLIEIDGVKTQVIAVLPQDFEMPSAQATDLLLPRQVDLSAVRGGSVWETMRVFARLKSGVTVAQARASLEPLFEQSLMRLVPPQMRGDAHLVVRSLRDRQMHDVIPVAWIMLGTVLVVLLVCCANAGSLFLARTAAREQEFAIRAAMGAGKRRILRQTLTEGLLLSFVSAVVGCILAEALLRTFVALAPDGMSFLRRATLDFRILLATLAVSFACGIVCGLLPLLGLHSVSIAARTTRPGIRPNLRRILVVTQIASSAVLLSGAALLLRSLENIERQDIGINSAHLLTVSASLSPRRYNTTQRMDFFVHVVTALRGIPGVTSVAMADLVPPNGSRHWYSSMAIAGKPPLKSEDVVSERHVTPDYFDALGIRIVRGRGFSNTDATSTEHLMVINQELASLMFPGEDPLGQQIRSDKDGPFYRVIGIAADARNDGLTERTLPEYDTLLGAMPDEWSNTYSGTLIVQSALAATTAAPWIRQRIEEIDSLIPIEIQTMDSEIRTLAARPRFETALLGFFAAAGLLIASIGLYGVTAYAATKRTNEIGIRMALGATRVDVLRLIMLEGLHLVFLGGAIGLVTALSTAHLLRSLLFEVGPYDPISFVCVAVLLALVAIAAIFAPAMRAMRVDPMVALRYE